MSRLILTAKKSLLLLSIILCCASQNSSYGQYIVSERIGEVIDSTEREYFFLFQEIKNFQSATIEKKNEDSYSIFINYEQENKSEKSIMDVPNTTIHALKKYIEEFETICTEDFFFPTDMMWERLYKIARPQIYFEFKEEVVLTLRQGGTVEGQLMFCYGDYILIWTGDGNFDWKEKEKIIAVHCSEIKEFDEPISISVNGNKRTFSELSEQIVNEVFYTTSEKIMGKIYPPELQYILEKKAEQLKGLQLPEPEPIPETVYNPEVEKFSFTLFPIISWKYYTGSIGSRVYSCCDTRNYISGATSLFQCSPNIEMRYNMLEYLSISLRLSYEIKS